MMREERARRYKTAGGFLQSIINHKAVKCLALLPVGDVTNIK